MTAGDRHHVRSESEAQTEALGAALGRLCVGGEVIALRGDLGAGKTCLVRGLARGLGVDPEAVASPTFVVCVAHCGSRLDLAHVDAYRLSGSEELESIGWDEMRGRSDLVVAVEWPERIADAIGDGAIEIALGHEGDDARSIELAGPAPLVAAWRAALRGAPCRTCGTPVPAGARTEPFCSPRCRAADLWHFI